MWGAAAAAAAAAEWGVCYLIIYLLVDAAGEISDMVVLSASAESKICLAVFHVFRPRAGTHKRDLNKSTSTMATSRSTACYVLDTRHKVTTTSTMSLQSPPQIKF